jgi:hypothetical protein
VCRWYVASLWSDSAVTDDLAVFARGDVRGFGLGHSSAQACDVVVGFEYRCCACASFAGGYRWLKIDRETRVAGTASCSMPP